MADDLETYLQDDYVRDKAPIAAIAKLTNEVTQVFNEAFLNPEKAWPYELRDTKEIESPKDFTFSTSAMIMFSLGVVDGRVTKSSLLPSSASLQDDSRNRKQMGESESVVGLALDQLITKSEELDGRVDEAEREPDKKEELLGNLHRLEIPSATWRPVLTGSATFGWDDPFTLTWLIELLAFESDGRRKTFRDQLCKRAKKLIQAVFANPQKDILRGFADEEVRHAFTLLRVLQLRDAVARVEGDAGTAESDLRMMRDLFFERAHVHLSESRVRDSGFDAAELVFSVEGWLLATPDAPSNLAVVEAMFEVP